MISIRKCLENIKPYIPGKLKPGAIKMASNENPLGPSPKAIAKIKETAEQVYLYPDGACTKLKAELSKKYKLNQDQFVFGNGSDELLLLITGAFMEEGLNAVTSESTFSEYTFATTLFGGTMKYAKMSDGTFDLQNIQNKVDENTKMIFLCNPNNPTGTYFPANDLADFMENISAEILVVLDEAYFEYVSADDYPDSVSLIEKYPNILVLRTFSKAYGLAGLRIGYGISSPAVITDLNKAREPFNVNLIAQEAATAALNDQEFIKESNQVNDDGKKYLYKEFDRLNLKYYKTQTNFIFVFIKKDCMDAFNQIMDKGVTIRPMKSFGYDDAIRVTVGKKEQNQTFIKCLEEFLSC